MRKEKSYSFPAILAAAAILLAYLCRITTKFGFELRLQEELILPLTLLRSMIYLCLFMAWGISLKMRIQQKQVQKYMIGAAVLIVFWIFVRSLRFMIFTVPPAPRYLWYMYYLPLLALPTSALMVALSIGKSDDYRLPQHVVMLWTIPALLFLLVMTNDLHQFVFKFPAEQSFMEWNNDYSYGFGFVLVTAWELISSVTAFAMLLKKCRLPWNRRLAWLPAVPLALSFLYLGMYGFNFKWFFLFFGDMTVVQSLLCAATLEGCIQFGLIQSNSHYGELFEAVNGCSAQITDRDFKVKFLATDAESFSEERIRAAEKAPLRLDDGKVLHTMPVSGGYAVWTEDNAELIALAEELGDLQEELKDRNELLRYEYEREKVRKEIEEQNRLYDLLQSVTQKQIDGIAALVKEYQQSGDKSSESARCILAKIAVLCSFIKRRKHLALSNYKDYRIPAEELRSAFRESMQTLELLDVSHSFYFAETELLDGSEATALYDFFEDVIEAALDSLRSVNVRISRFGGRRRIAVTLECEAELSALARDYPGAELDNDEGEWTCLLTLGTGGEGR